MFRSHDHLQGATQCNSLKKILGSKHVGAILNILM